MNSLPITTLVAGLMALLIVLLSVQVSTRRAKIKVVFGDAGDEVLRRRVRAHGNFIEYAPLAVIVLGLAEFAGASPIFCKALGGAFVLSRVIHAVGMLYTLTPVWRAIAMLLNHVSFIVAGVWLVFLSR